jgi:hypothetical protein
MIMAIRVTDRNDYCKRKSTQANKNSFEDIEL